MNQPTSTLPSVLRPPSSLSYGRAPEGSPDAFVLTADSTFYWDNPPAWVWDMVKTAVGLESGLIWRQTEPAAVSGVYVRRICLCIGRGFFFSVSVAPDTPQVTPWSCPHDWIYARAPQLAAAWGVPVRTVLKFGDHFFLAGMRATGFRFKLSYVLGVTLFGYPFHRLSRLFTINS